MSIRIKKIPKTPFPQPKKILTRGMYELMWGAKPRNYAKRVGINSK